jgi:hypothetical protein
MGPQRQPGRRVEMSLNWVMRDRRSS